MEETMQSVRAQRRDEPHLKECVLVRDDYGKNSIVRRASWFTFVCMETTALEPGASQEVVHAH
jgi:hypothetical protein